MQLMDSSPTNSILVGREQHLLGKRQTLRPVPLGDILVPPQNASSFQRVSSVVSQSQLVRLRLKRLQPGIVLPEHELKPQMANKFFGGAPT